MSLKHHRKTLLEMKREPLQVQETGGQAEQTVELDQARIRARILPYSSASPTKYKKLYWLTP